MGRCPCTPKLSGVGTIPRPKSCFQIRLTITRATRARRGRIGPGQPARQRQPPAAGAGEWGGGRRQGLGVRRLSTRKKPGGTSWPGLCSLPRTRRCVGGGGPSRRGPGSCPTCGVPRSRRSRLRARGRRLLGGAQARGDLVGLDGQRRGEFLGQILLNRRALSAGVRSAVLCRRGSLAATLSLASKRRSSHGRRAGQLPPQVSRRRSTSALAARSPLARPVPRRQARGPCSWSRWG